MCSGGTSDDDRPTQDRRDEGARGRALRRRTATQRAARLGAKLADGIEEAACRHGLPLSAHRLYCRSGYHFAPRLPRDNAGAEAAADPEIRDLMLVYMANRGVREAVFSASPAISLAATEADVGLYLEVLDACLSELVA